jgi:hypothetical protein
VKKSFLLLPEFNLRTCQELRVKFFCLGTIVCPHFAHSSVKRILPKTCGSKLIMHKMENKIEIDNV